VGVTVLEAVVGISFAFWLIKAANSLFVDIYDQAPLIV
jgi:hypothetical protein